jgi:hypothetical protein
MPVGVRVGCALVCVGVGIILGKIGWQAARAITSKMDNLKNKPFIVNLHNN